MPLNDLKISGRTAIFAEQVRGVNHVYRQARFLSSDGASSAPCFSSMCRSLQRQLQGQGVLLPRAVSLHGICPVDLPREPAGHRILSAGTEEQALSHGNPLVGLPQQPGKCQQGPRLAHLCRSCALSHSDGPQALQQRSFWTNWRTRSTLWTPRPSTCVSPCSRGPTSARTREPSSSILCWICGAASRPSSTYPTANSTRSTPWTSCRWRQGLSTSWIGDTWTSNGCNTFTGISLLRDPGQIKSQVPTGLFPSGGRSTGLICDQSVQLTGFQCQGLSGQAAPGEVSRHRNRQNLGVPDQQLHPASHDHCRTVSLPLAGRAVLPMDQAKPADQDLLRHIGECSQSPDLDCRVGLCARCHHEETAQIRASLYTILQVLSVTIFERMPFCSHLQIQITEAKQTKIITSCFYSTKRWDTTDRISVIGNR